MISIDIYIYPWILQNPQIIRLMNIYTDMEKARMSYLSNRIDTNIIFFFFEWGEDIEQ